VLFEIFSLLLETQMQQNEEFALWRREGRALPMVSF